MNIDEAKVLIENILWQACDMDLIMYVEYMQAQECLEKLVLLARLKDET